MDKQKQKRSQADLSQEYVDASQNYRHYSNLRFAIFTIYFAVIAGIIVIAFNNDNRFTPYAIQSAKIGGLLITLVFWNYQERASMMTTHFAKVAKELEHSLGYNQYSTRPKTYFPILEAKYITRILFTSLTVFWIYTICVSMTNR
ncbi:MAG: hypothetical protein ACOYZ8_00910 [Chloroflexota bacterium]